MYKPYKKIFRENWFTSIEPPLYSKKYFDGEVPIYINPKFKELKDIKREDFSGLRGLVNEAGHLLVWNGMITHWDVIRRLKDDPDFQRLYKGNHEYLRGRNYISVKINSYYDVDLGDGEMLGHILNYDKLDIKKLLHNMMQRNGYLDELKDTFIEELEDKNIYI